MGYCSSNDVGDNRHPSAENRPKGEMGPFIHLHATRGHSGRSEEKLRMGLDWFGRRRGGTRNGGQPTFGRRKPEFATAMPMPMRRRQHNFAKRGRAQLWLEERHFTTSTGYQTDRESEKGRESQNCHASVCRPSSYTIPEGFAKASHGMG